MLEDSLSSDGELVQRVLAGDTNSFGFLVNRYERLTRSIAVSYVGELHTADDVVQDAFVAAFQSLASLKDKQLFGVWLQGIVRRRAISAFERLSRQSTNVDLQDFPNERQHSGFTESSIELLELIDQLPDHERLVIILKHFEGHTASEIALITGQPIGTITKQISRARQRLQQSLTKGEINEIRSES